MTGAHHWNHDRTRLEFAPGVPLDVARYLVELGADACDDLGRPLGRPARAVFTTTPPVVFEVAWNEDHTEATLTPTASLTPGHYEVTVGGRAASGRALADVVSQFAVAGGGGLIPG